MRTEKIFFYCVLAILPVYIMLTVFDDIVNGTESGAIQRCIEWLTTYILPWIFLYWFIKLVRKIK